MSLKFKNNVKDEISYGQYFLKQLELIEKDMYDLTHPRVIEDRKYYQGIKYAFSLTIDYVKEDRKHDLIISEVHKDDCKIDVYDDEIEVQTELFDGKINLDNVRALDFHVIREFELPR